MRLIYRSKNGQIEMDGDNGYGIGLLSVEGLGIPKKNYKTIEFSGENGVTQVAENDLARTITITGDTTLDAQARRRIGRVFHEKGELFLFLSPECYKIECKCVNPPSFRHVGAGIYTFTVQLQADYPYFTDFHTIRIPVFSRRNLVRDTFTLPCVFTERTTRATVNLHGDKYVYPVITVTNSAETAAEGDHLIITNERSGAVIRLNYMPVGGDEVTIDLAHRRIESSVNGNITNNISDDTDLSKFYLDEGENVISAVTSVEDGYKKLLVYIQYNNEYYSAEV